jgi:hypothetical protein
MSSAPTGNRITLATVEMSELSPKHTASSGRVAAQARSASTAMARSPGFPAPRALSSAAVANMESTKPG